MSKVRCVLDAHAVLAEGPVWDVQEQALYWVDILGRTFNRFDPRPALRAARRILILRRQWAGTWVSARQHAFRGAIGPRKANPS
ncbi:MAG: SMP-30/gluconolactonase/LRE family protein [Alphaproteobacteria bacterium]|nr:SMP-30/gluconolactonase/LRE family protein [Alphaproteobacteria bacterium]